jgi:hypothetical protein
MKRKLPLALAMLLSLWPAAVVVEAATTSKLSAPRLLFPARAARAAGLITLEARQRALAMEAELSVAEAAAPDLAARAARQREDVANWRRAHGGGGRAVAIATAMASLDQAIAALADDPSPGARIVFERALADYDTAISNGPLLI